MIKNPVPWRSECHSEAASGIGLGVLVSKYPLLQEHPMPRRAKPFPHQGHYSSSIGGKQRRLCPIEEGVERAEEELRKLQWVARNWSSTTAATPG